MRILFLSQLVPYPLDTGAKVRIYYVLRHLAQAGHAVSLLAFSRPEDKPESLAHLRDLCAEVVTVPMRRSVGRDIKGYLNSLMTRQPFLIARDAVPAMYEALGRMAAGGDFEAVHADQLWMAQYALSVKEKFPEMLAVLDQHNAVYRIPERMAAGAGNPLVKLALKREARLMRRYEREVCPQFDRVVWVTQEDQAAVSYKEMQDDAVIPICIDLDAEQAVGRAEEARRVTFLGGLHWPPNAEGVAWFVDQVWERVLAQCPGALLTVIGKEPTGRLSRRAGAAPQATFLGYVEDLQPFLRETAVFIVPLLAGGGMRVKILEAWNWGLPVVSTRIGAEGLAYRDGENLLIADGAEDFAGAVARVLNEGQLARRLAAGGRETVDKHYDWRKVYTAWEGIYGG